MRRRAIIRELAHALVILLRDLGRELTGAAQLHQTRYAQRVRYGR